MEQIWYESPQGDNFIGVFIEDELSQMAKIKYLYKRIWRTCVVPKSSIKPRAVDYSAELFKIREAQFRGTPLVFSLPGGDADG